MTQTPAPYDVPDTPPVALLQCRLAGFAFHGGAAVLPRLCPGAELVLRREPGNRHDPRAIAVEWHDVMLGYLPRESNGELSRMMDDGATASARIVWVRPRGNGDAELMMEVAARSTDHALERAGRDLLVRSLVNRVFGPTPPEGAHEWVGQRVEAIALVGVEQPGMLPFLRIVARDRHASGHPEPLAALRGELLANGLEKAAWKWLPRWEFDAFRNLDGWLAPIPVALLANLLFHMGVHTPPSPHLVKYVRSAALYRCDSRPLDFERHPRWFMRALLQGVAATVTRDQHEELEAELPRCIDWLLDAEPQPDANQQRAGWPWVVAQAREFLASRERGRRPWAVPVPEATFGNWWVVPIANAAELAEEARAMRNCLEEYREDCEAGSAIVFSIRDALTAERAACFCVGREEPGGDWKLEQVAGPGNARVSDELYAIASIVALRLAGGSGRG